MVKSIIIQDDIAYVNTDPSQVPDIGTWKCYATESNGIRHYIGDDSDSSKLPTYAPIGSTAIGDTGSGVKKYIKTDTDWVEDTAA